MKLNEAPQLVNKSLYPNVEFKSGVIQGANPEGDKINPLLLLDIQTAAKNSGTKPVITTAVSGHEHTPSRHPEGNAVDIAIFNGKGWSSLEDAQKKGIYLQIYNFVKELQKLGYKLNSESGSDKAVLTFGFSDGNHENHVHVSNKLDTGISPQASTTPTTSQETPVDTQPSVATEFLSSFLNPALKGVGFKESKLTENDRLIENINRIKKLL